MGARSELTTPSPNGHTHQHQASTWASHPMVAAVAAAAVVVEAAMEVAAVAVATVVATGTVRHPPTTAGGGATLALGLGRTPPGGTDTTERAHTSVCTPLLLLPPLPPLCQSFSYISSGHPEAAVHLNKGSSAAHITCSFPPFERE